MTQGAKLRRALLRPLGTLLLLACSGCKNTPPLTVSNPVPVDGPAIYDHETGSWPPLRLSASEWKQLRRSVYGPPDFKCGEANYLPFELLVSAEGKVGLVHLLPLDAYCNDIPFPAAPGPIVSRHLKEAEALMKARRFTPWLVNGRPVSVWLEESLTIAPPERWGVLRPFPASFDLLAASIRLERRGCEGECPIYVVNIAGDGTVTYQGVRYVQAVGLRQTHIPVAAVEKLLQRFRDANFLSAMPEYTGGFDGGDALIKLSLNGQSYQVEDQMGLYAGLPTDIHELEEAVDSTAGTKVWIEGTAARSEAAAHFGP